MSMNAKYVATMEAQLKKWDTAVDALAAAGEKAGAEARVAYNERIRELRASRSATQQTLREFRFAGESAGAQMQAGMQSAWDKMQKALEKAASDLGK